MGQKIVKRQHYVPRTYLKHFSKLIDDKYIINALPRLENKEKKIFESNIENVCLKKHIYTLPGNTPEEKMLLEKFYSDEFESKYDDIYSILVDPNKKTITKDERDLIISTVVTMFYRTTWWLNQHKDLIKRLFENMFQVCKQTGKDYFIFEKKKISIAGKTVEQLVKEYTEKNRPMHVLTQLEVAMKLRKKRIERDTIHVSKLDEQETEFITSDNPVIAANPYQKRPIPFDEENILKLPLDNKHILYLFPYFGKDTHKLINRKNISGKTAKMEKLVTNYELVSMAQRFIFGSKSALKSYLTTKEKSERTLTDKENRVIKSYKDILDKGEELGLF